MAYRKAPPHSIRVHQNEEAYRLVCGVTNSDERILLPAAGPSNANASEDADGPRLQSARPKKNGF